MSATAVFPRKSDVVISPPRLKIHALTSARFFAALYVIFLHTQWGIPPGSAIYRLVSIGPSSVCFFFLLSGYILGVVYLNAGKSVAPGNFYVARFARIYPLYIVSVLADAPFAVAGRVAKYGLVVAIERVLVLVSGGAFMLQMCVPTNTVVNIPSWSLAIETVFYLSFPLLGVHLWKLHKGSLLLVASGLYVVSLLMYWIIVQYKSEPVSGIVLPSYVATFAIGILLARWQTLHVGDPSWRGVSDKTAWTVFALAGIAFVVAMYASPWMTRNGIHLGLVLAPVSVAMIWLLSSAQILPVRWLSAKWLVVLGQASYGMYLLHVPVLHMFKLFNFYGSAWNYPLALSTIIGLSILSFYFLEAPSRRWILKYFHSRTKETMEVASAAQ